MLQLPQCPEHLANVPGNQSLVRQVLKSQVAEREVADGSIRHGVEIHAVGVLPFDVLDPTNIWSP